MRLVIKWIQYIQLSLAIRSLEEEMANYCFLYFSLEQSMYQEDKWTHEDLPFIYEELNTYQACLDELERMVSLLMDRRFQLFKPMTTK